MVRLVVLLFFLASSVFGQRLTFEVVSIKPSNPNPTGGGIKALSGGQGYTAQNVPVKLMMALMYKVPAAQIKGGPAWLNTDLYDVEARADHSYNLDDLHAMFQNLLADEFHLKFHKESHEGPVFALTVDKGGLRMTANTGPQDYNVPIVGGVGGGVGKRVPMDYLCWWLGLFALGRDGRPVIDQTGLTGNYDFTLKFSPEGVQDDKSDTPDIFGAVKQQLGLELKAGRGPVEFLVIDSVERPAAN